MGIPYPAEVLKFIMIGDQPFYDKDTFVAMIRCHDTGYGQASITDS